jgi:hypothetical protein
MPGITIDGGLTLQYADVPTATRTAVAPITVSGTAVISTAQFVFGNASLRTFGANSDVAITNTGALNLGTGDFTIEARVRPVSRITSNPHIFSNYVIGFTTNNWVLVDRSPESITKFSFFVNNVNSGSAILTSTTSVVNDTWYAIAITRSGNNWTLYINGNAESTTTSSASLDGNVTQTLRINPSSAFTGYNGFVDEYRISNISRYSGNYTIATTPFVNDTNTLLLLHCDGANNSTSLPDDNISILPTGLTIVY